MNTKTPAAWLGSLFVMIAVANPLSAQSTSAASAPDTAVQLSPFIVNSDKDTGYQATTTLAGTRLDTPLKDLGAAISIYTKDFLEDINATNSGEFFQYATGMEAAGPGGNYAGTTDLNTSAPAPDRLREEVQGTSRSRGLAAPTFTRDLYVSAIDIDTYNTERITVLRGPNAALIGVSSPAGVTDTTLLRADTARNRNRVVFRYGNNDSTRSTVDFNRVLIPDKLAVRLAGLQAREEFNQRPAYEFKERIYGTLTFKPFKATTVRGNFESGRMRANRPQIYLPLDGISREWYAAGRPGFDWRFYDDPALNPLAASQNALNFYPYFIGNSANSGVSIYNIYNNPDDKAPGLIIHNGNPTTNAAVGNAVKNNLFHPLLNRDTAQDSVRYVSTLNVFEFVPATYWIGGNVLPNNPAGLAPPGLKQQGLLNYNSFNFRDRILDETGFFRDNFHAFNVTLEQNAWENRLGIALAYDKQRQDRASFATFFSGANTNHVRLDVGATGLDGLPNPNYGRPYVVNQAGYRWTHRDTDDETLRATAFLKYNFKDLGDGWTKWLGSHTLSGVAERYRRDFISTNPFSKINGPIPRLLQPNLGSRNYTTVVYVGPSIIGNTNPLRLNPIRIPTLRLGPLGDLTYFSRAADNTDPGTFARSPVSMTEILNAGQLTREVIESQAATLQSYWLQDHIATVMGWRRDTDYFASRTINFISNPADLNDPGKTMWGFNDFNFPHTPPKNLGAETKSYSVVLRWPQNLFRLPGGANLSIFYNNSENFTPVGGRINVFTNEPLPVPKGTTQEYGLNFSAFNDKLSIRFNRFETVNKNLSYGIGFDTGIRTTVLRWLVEGNVNPQLVAMRNADVATLLSVYPGGAARYMQIWNIVVTGTAPNLVATSNSNVPGGAHTVDFAAKGLELDVVYNPTPNWRILANVAKQQTVKSNMVPALVAEGERLAPIVAQLAGRAAGAYPAGWTPGTPLPANVETFGSQYDRTFLGPLATELSTQGFPSAEQRPWRANLVTNYTFGRNSIFGEKLKGFGIGGGLRWQDKFILAFPPSRSAAGVISFDRARPFYAPTETNMDMFVSYQRKVWDSRIDWKVQLNVSNLYGTVNPIPIGAQPWGEISMMRNPPERRWYLTNAFSF